MKKIILAAIIAFGFISCSDENDSSEKTSATNKTKVTAKIAVGKEDFPSTTGNVERGNIPTTINKITVDVVNNNAAVPPLKQYLIWLQTEPQEQKTFFILTM